MKPKFIFIFFAASVIAFFVCVLHFNNRTNRLEQEIHSLRANRLGDLQNAEKAEIAKCISTKDQDSDRGHSAFWSGNNQYVRLTTHTYLNKESLVLDVGGNIGFDAEEFRKRYGPKMIIFEPLPSYFERLKKRFANFSEITVNKFGLGTSNLDLFMEVKGHDGDASSIFTGEKVTTGEKIKIRKTEEIFKELDLEHTPIDLLHINCEGCEYDVMESVINSNLINNMKHVQFAAHTQYAGLVNPVQRYCIIQALLRRTHKIVYQYKYTWESWEKK